MINSINSVQAAATQTPPYDPSFDPERPYYGEPPYMKRGTYDVHVVPIGKHWAVKAENEHLYSAVELTQTEAMAYAMQLARNTGAQMVVHGKNGRVREVRDYWSPLEQATEGVKTLAA